ncbi:hypothetical protein MNV84_03257 [Leishmania braziliensis]|nr:hypothetical protein MNV84_03257 [Leishmania braziliensis]CAJ2472250.1 unnamed protein product [Leishmania braziliensis]
MAVTPHVAQRQEALRQLERLPHDVLSGMLCDVKAQLQQERRALSDGQKELEHVQLQLAKLNKDLKTVQRQREQEHQQASKCADAVARTSRLLRAARRRGPKYEEAIARTLDEIHQIRRGHVAVAAPPTSPSAISVDMDVSSINASAQHHADVSVGVAVPPTLARESNRAAAAARAANEGQRLSVFLHALEKRVARVERENRMLLRSIDILNRGDASSARLYHELESLRFLRGV